MGHTQTVTTRGYLGTSFPPFPAVLVSTWPGQGLDAVHRTDHVVIVLEKGAAARESHPPHVGCEYPLVLVVLKPLQQVHYLKLREKIIETTNQ